MAHALRLGVVYDFRNPPDSGMDNPSLYAAILDQVAWLDGLGLDLVWFTEHHFVDDGYLPSWIPVAAAMASRTRRVRFSCDVCLLPFNHPIRLAEDLAVLDNLSNGRVEIGVGGNISLSDNGGLERTQTNIFSPSWRSSRNFRRKNFSLRDSCSLTCSLVA